MSAVKIHTADEITEKERHRSEKFESILTHSRTGEDVIIALHVSFVQEPLTVGSFSEAKALELLGFEAYDNCRFAKSACYSIPLARLEDRLFGQEKDADVKKQEFSLIAEWLPSVVKCLILAAKYADKCGLKIELEYTRR